MADSRPSVLLVTNFRPETGGGGTILRSLLPVLASEFGLDVAWAYFAASPASNESPAEHHLGPPLSRPGVRGLVDLVRLWMGPDSSAMVSVADDLMARKASTYWVVGDLECVLLADVLARRGARVHLTMHDDLAHAQFARSRRLRWFTAIADRRLRRAIGSASTMDVVSAGMRDYYASTFGSRSIVVHRFLPPLPERRPGELPSPTDQVTVGHIGSIYSAAEFSAFCRALVRYADDTGLTPHVLLIGSESPTSVSLQLEHGDLIDSIGHRDEDEAVKLLKACDFLYAMYPFDDRLEVFRRTSSPTKITTYLQARRPVFAHTPPDSSLHDVVQSFGLGRSCSTSDADALVAEVRAILASARDGEFSDDRFEQARAELHGIKTVEALARCLTEGRYPSVGSDLDGQSLP